MNVLKQHRWCNGYRTW